MEKYSGFEVQKQSEEETDVKKEDILKKLGIAPGSRYARFIKVQRDGNVTIDYLDTGKLENLTERNFPLIKKLIETIENLSS